MLPIFRNEKFGTFSLWKQLSDKQSNLSVWHPTAFAALQEEAGSCGVTMAERGVSQLVSVDLETAAKFKEAV